jgi:hypothetical protein
MINKCFFLVSFLVLCSCNNQKENSAFNNFFDEFKGDSLYQINHIGFPVPVLSYMEGEEGLIVDYEIESENWQFEEFESNDQYQVLKRYKSNNDTVNVVFRGIDNGINIDYVFVVCKADEWCLKKIIDKSN